MLAPHANPSVGDGHAGDRLGSGYPVARTVDSGVAALSSPESRSLRACTGDALLARSLAPSGKDTSDDTRRGGERRSTPRR